MKSISNKADLTRNLLALKSLQGALSFLPLIQHRLGSEDAYWLYGGMCVFYAKPFKHVHKKDGYHPIPIEGVVPEDLRDCHDTLIEYRNKVIAHTDSNYESLGSKINRAHIRVQATCNVEIESMHPNVSSIGISRIERLIKSVRHTIEQVTTPFLTASNHLLFPTGATPGLYRLAIDEDVTNWLELIPEDGASGPF